MQEDKKLQSLLNTYSIQEPSAEFDDKVMQLIAASENTEYFVIKLFNKTFAAHNFYNRSSYLVYYNTIHAAKNIYSANFNSSIP